MNCSTNDNLRTIQLAELDIMKQLLPIIEKYHLRYYIIDGTLLGAVRHKGFIPWDDDMDIGLPRPDYERLLDIIENELPDPYQVHALGHLPKEYYYYYFRVENPNVLVERNSTNKKVVIPTWVDVFPLDGVPDEETELEKWLKKTKRLRLLFQISQFDYFFNTKSTRKGTQLTIIAKKIISATKIYRIFNPQKVWNKLDLHLKTNNYEDCSRLINSFSFYGKKDMFYKTIYGEGKKYPFEDLMLNGPDDYEMVLTQLYGDYMKLPPEEERDRHSIQLLQQ